MKSVEFNYRVAWKRGRGYFAQFWGCNQWFDLNEKGWRSHIDAIVDCKLAAARTGETCRIDPMVRPPVEDYRAVS